MILLIYFLLLWCKVMDYWVLEYYGGDIIWVNLYLCVWEKVFVCYGVLV